MKSQDTKRSQASNSKRQLRAAPLGLVTGFVAAGLLLFGGQIATAQETSTIATDTTIVSEATVLASDAATDSTLVAVSDSEAAVADDSTPAGSLETGFGGTASESDSNRSGLYVAAAGVSLLGALAARKLVKRSAIDSDRPSK